MIVFDAGEQQKYFMGTLAEQEILLSTASLSHIKIVNYTSAKSYPRQQ